MVSGSERCHAAFLTCTTAYSVGLCFSGLCARLSVLFLIGLCESDWSASPVGSSSALLPICITPPCLLRLAGRLPPTMDDDSVEAVSHRELGHRVAGASHSAITCTATSAMYLRRIAAFSLPIVSTNPYVDTILSADWPSTGWDHRTQTDHESNVSFLAANLLS
jgi:hypothetical protein